MALPPNHVGNNMNGNHLHNSQNLQQYQRPPFQQTLANQSNMANSGRQHPLSQVQYPATSNQPQQQQLQHQMYTPVSQMMAPQQQAQYHQQQHQMYIQPGPQLNLQIPAQAQNRYNYQQANNYTASQPSTPGPPGNNNSNYKGNNNTMPHTPTVQTPSAIPVNGQYSALTPTTGPVRTPVHSVLNASTTVKNEEGSDEEEEDDFGAFGSSTLLNPETDDATIKEKQRMKLLLDSFNADQMARYEVFRRVTLPKNNVKRLANSVLLHSVSENVGVVLRGAGKVFVGEIVERARAVQKKWGEEGRLSPDHLREAYRQLRVDGHLNPQHGSNKRMFK